MTDTPSKTVEAVARAIFMANPPKPFIASDWDNGAILGRDNAHRNESYETALAAIKAHTECEPEFKYTKVGHLTKVVDGFLKFIGEKDPENASDEYADHLKGMALAVYKVQQQAMLSAQEKA